MITPRRASQMLGLIFLMIVMTCSGLITWFIIYRPIPIQTQNIIHVHKNTNATVLMQDMHTKGWITSVRLWVWLLKFQGLSTKLKAGIYQLQPQESAQHLLRRIVAGDVLQERFLILPGSTVVQISKDLNTATYVAYQASDWKVITASNGSAEGLVLADTYVYDAGSTGQDLIHQAHSHLQTVLNQIWENRNSDLPYESAYDLLIAASILEKEAALPEERRLISGVILNRLRRHMPLQMDPTVIYALGSQYTGALSHEQMSVDSPYNTYTHQGLPPTPIATVSADALDAAAHPNQNTYLYFLAKGDGTHIFTSTYHEHCAAIKRYMRKAA